MEKSRIDDDSHRSLRPTPLIRPSIRKWSGLEAFVDYVLPDTSVTKNPLYKLIKLDQYFQPIDLPNLRSKIKMAYLTC